MIKASTYLKAQKIAAAWPASTKGGSKRVIAVAALIHWLQGRSSTTSIVRLRDGSNIDWGALDWQEALSALACSHDWLNATPQKASEKAARGVSILQTCGYAIKSSSPDSLISAYQISSMESAANVSKALAKLSGSGDLNTDLGRGLVSALNSWFDGEMNGWLKPNELQSFRKAKGLLQNKKITKSQVARRIKKTYRQYHRYENGETPIPQDVAIELIEYLVPITPLRTAGASKSPKRAKTHTKKVEVWLKGAQSAALGRLSS